METKQTTAVDYFFDKIKSHFEHDGDLLESVTFLYAICKEKEREHSEQAIAMEREQVRLPRWVQFSERKPAEPGYYFVKGKGECGAYLHYFADLEEFELGNLPANKYADEYLQWLEE